MTNGGKSMARNEYGHPLDSNGYSPSLLNKTDCSCYVCGQEGVLARHEPIGGPFRQKSKRLGLWVSICPACHELAHGSGIMANAVALQLKQDAQRTAMEEYGWSTEEFIQQFGKNYL